MVGAVPEPTKPPKWKPTAKIMSRKPVPEPKFAPAPPPGPPPPHMLCGTVAALTPKSKAKKPVPKQMPVKKKIGAPASGQDNNKTKKAKKTEDIGLHDVELIDVCMDDEHVQHALLEELTQTWVDAGGNDGDDEDEGYIDDNDDPHGDHGDDDDPDDNDDPHGDPVDNNKAPKKKGKRARGTKNRGGKKVQFKRMMVLLRSIQQARPAD